MHRDSASGSSGRQATLDLNLCLRWQIFGLLKGGYGFAHISPPHFE
jgi:hypothetical protein